jgi:CheY-like chemotaxis protein
MLARRKKTPCAFVQVANWRSCFTLNPISVDSVIRVAMIEDQKETREGLSFLINSADGFDCHHVYGSMEAALDGIAINPPRVALVDIGLPGMSGIEGVRVLRARHPAIAPVLLTVYKDDARIFEAICAGACGYLLKTTPPPRSTAGNSRGRCCHVTGGRDSRGGTAAQIANTRTIFGEPFTAGNAAVEAADGGTSE